MLVLGTTGKGGVLKKIFFFFGGGGVKKLQKLIKCIYIHFLLFYDSDKYLWGGGGQTP